MYSPKTYVIEGLLEQEGEQLLEANPNYINAGSKLDNWNIQANRVQVMPVKSPNDPPTPAFGCGKLLQVADGLVTVYLEGLSLDLEVPMLYHIQCVDFPSRWKFRRRYENLQIRNHHCSPESRNQLVDNIHQYLKKVNKKAGNVLSLHAGILYSCTPYLIACNSDNSCWLLSPHPLSRIIKEKGVVYA